MIDLQPLADNTVFVSTDVSLKFDLDVCVCVVSICFYLTHFTEHVKQ